MPEITNDLMDMIISDESPSSVSDKIKDILFAKTSEKVDSVRPDVAKNTFVNFKQSSTIRVSI